MNFHEYNYNGHHMIDMDFGNWFYLPVVEKKYDSLFYKFKAIIKFQLKIHYLEKIYKI